MTEPQQAQPKQVEVTLKKNHTHAGEQKKPGDKITVSPGVADWLRNEGVIA